MSTVKQIVWNIRQSIRSKLFSNNHSISTNLAYAAYHKKAKARWAPPKDTQDERESAAEFSTQGFKVFGPPANMKPAALQSLKTKVDDLFAEAGGSISIGAGVSRLIDGLEKVPEIVDFIDPQMERVIERFFESHFKVFGVYFYHTEPFPAKPKSSFLWHADNCPNEEIKLMVYLDDVRANTGAIRLKTKATSDDLKGRGFVDRRMYEKFRAELDDPNTTSVIEAPLGTRLLFRNGRAIHKAVLPEAQHRDVVTFVLIPSTIPWRVHYARNRHLLSTNSGICLDPATDLPQSVGYTD